MSSMYLQSKVYGAHWAWIHGDVISALHYKRMKWQVKSIHALITDNWTGCVINEISYVSFFQFCLVLQNKSLVAVKWKVKKLLRCDQYIRGPHRSTEIDPYDKAVWLSLTKLTSSLLPLSVWQRSFSTADYFHSVLTICQNTLTNTVHSGVCVLVFYWYIVVFSI